MIPLGWAEEGSERWEMRGRLWIYGAHSPSGLAECWVEPEDETYTLIKPSLVAAFKEEELSSF